MRLPAEKLNARQRGAVIVEMALVTPILLLIMLATAEVTRAVIDHNTLTKAVRNGARYVAIHENAIQGSTGLVVITAVVRAKTKNLVVYGNTAGAGTPVLPGLTVANITVTDIGADHILVSASHPISGILGPVLNSFYGGPGINLAYNLRATVAMRAL
jgi:Flp pilus assembly protein TadG